MQVKVQKYTKDIPNVPWYGINSRSLNESLYIWLSIVSVNYYFSLYIRSTRLGAVHIRKRKNTEQKAESVTFRIPGLPPNTCFTLRVSYYRSIKSHIHTIVTLVTTTLLYKKCYSNLNISKNFRIPLIY